jgi:hypothetical protein
VLSRLRDDEAFFSIDEFGPFAVKMRGVRTVPQWQKSKGSPIVSAALELSTNQVVHFYSERKNSGETIKLVGSVVDAQTAIPRYFEERNAAFSRHRVVQVERFGERSVCPARLRTLTTVRIPGISADYTRLT